MSQPGAQWAFEPMADSATAEAADGAQQQDRALRFREGCQRGDDFLVQRVRQGFPRTQPIGPGSPGWRLGKTLNLIGFERDLEFGNASALPIQRKTFIRQNLEQPRAKAGAVVIAIESAQRT